MLFYREEQLVIYIYVFIHRNPPLQLCNDNSTANVIVHELDHPFAWIWLCHNLMYVQKDTYDAFMYIEDDILVPNEANHYWQDMSPFVIRMNLY